MSACPTCGGTHLVVPWLGPKRPGLQWPCPDCSTCPLFDFAAPVGNPGGVRPARTSSPAAARGALTSIKRPRAAQTAGGMAHRSSPDEHQGQ